MDSIDSFFTLFSPPFFCHVLVPIAEEFFYADFSKSSKQNYPLTELSGAIVINCVFALVVVVKIMFVWCGAV